MFARKGTAAGAVTIDAFASSFTDKVKPIEARDSRELIDICQKLSVYLLNTDNDWNRRVDRLKEMRGLLIGGAHKRDDFIINCLPIFEDPLVISVKDLRSAVCREACVTTAYYAAILQEKFSKICESLLPTTMNLMQNSAKVMATSGFNANINTQILLKFILENWGDLLERLMPTIVQAVRAGIYDADAETRNRARECFTTLQQNFPVEADKLYQTLEVNKQRMLSGVTSTASSTHSINNDRDHLPFANRGIYNAQNVFLANRSTSELNPHTIRRIQHTNVKTNTKGLQPIVRPSAQTRTPVKASTPGPNYLVNRNTPNKVTPSMSKQIANNVPSSSKSLSQPGSRSGSPTRLRLPKQVSSNRANGEQTINNHQEDVDMNKVVKNLKHVTMDRNRYMQPNIRMESRNLNTPLRDHQNINYAEYNRNIRTPKASAGGFAYSNGNSATSISSGVVTTTSGSSISTDLDSLHHLIDKKDELSKNVDAQQKILQKICDTLNLEEKDSIEIIDIETSLSLLTKLASDCIISYAIWDQFFDSILYLLLKLIDKRTVIDLKTKLHVFRVIKDVADIKPERLLEKKEFTIISIINANEKDNTQISRAAEETGAFIAKRLPPHTCFEIFLPLVDQNKKSAEELTIATKILTRVIESLPSNEVAKYASQIVPAMAKCYEHIESIVRRSAIICLVAVSSAAGMDSLKPYLNASTLKLVEVYRQKIANSSAK